MKLIFVAKNGESMRVETLTCHGCGRPVKVEKEAFQMRVAGQGGYVRVCHNGCAIERVPDGN